MTDLLAILAWWCVLSLAAAFILAPRHRDSNRLRGRDDRLLRDLRRLRR